MLAVTLCTNAQRVSVSRMESDGRWQIMTSGKDVYMNGAKYSICLKAYIKNGKTDYCLLISSFYTIPNNAEVLVKLGNGETLYFPINNLNVGDINSSYIAGNTIVPISNKYYSSIYDISLEQLLKIRSFGILKMRITGGSSYREKIWRRDKLGKFLDRCKYVIDVEKSSHVTKGIWEGF